LKHMIDSMGLKVPGSFIKTENLENISDKVSGGFQASLTNLKIFQGTDGVFIRGSLPKYLNGENASTFSRQEAREALAKLERESGLDLRRGLVYQAEIGTTIPVEKPVPLYLLNWGSVPRFKKSIYSDGETVTYFQEWRSFSGYDKAAEIAPRALPEPLNDHYALRLELRIKKSMKRITGRFLSPWEITEPDFYKLFVSLWKKFYFRIPKRREVYLSMKGMKPKTLERTLAAFSIQEFGQDKLLTLIEAGRESGDFNRVTASRLRALIRELGQDERITDREKLTAEIDEKVMQAACRPR